MPQQKWVLSEVETYDAFAGDDDFDKGKSRTLSQFTYENGKYDRRDRTFYGFEKTTSKQLNPNNNEIFRYTVNRYLNHNAYFKGVNSETATYDHDDQLLSKSQNFYNLQKPEVSFTANFNSSIDQPYEAPGLGELDRTRAFPVLVKRIHTTYEQGQSLSLIEEFKEYDKYGNLTMYINRGSGPSDAYRTEIEYDYSHINSNFLSLPETIRVKKEADGSLLRQREAKYTNKGSLDEIITKLNATENNRVLFNYDNYGNRTLIMQADNLGNNGPFYQNIVYESDFHTYPQSISDAYGQTSETVYNLRFGIPVWVKDKNNNEMRTRIDNRGRIIEITGPKEMNLLSGQDWTIRYQYEGEDPVSTQVSGLGVQDYMANEAKGYFIDDIIAMYDPNYGGSTDAYQHHAVTQHTAGAADDEMVTISIVDGLGQPIQLKKTHFVSGNDLKWMVNGFDKKDAYGRVIENYLPQLQNNNNNALNSAALSYMPAGNLESLPLRTRYDVKDRPVKIYQPGETTSAQMHYGMEDGMMITELVNEKNQRLKTYTDLRGQQRKTVQNEEITTKFDFNTAGDLIQVTDTKGYQTLYEYDLAGRRTAEKSPDRGQTKFTYDKAGHLIKKQTANLMQPGSTGEIEYVYNYDRLLDINYPLHPENNVSFEYGTAADQDKNQHGRLKLQKDATGLQYFEYDDMGNVETNIRAVAVAGKTAYWFKTQWEYDSWNRIQQIVYPDNETVTYHYDRAGQVRKMTSDMNADLMTNLTYDAYGQRQILTYGNGTFIEYRYDQRQRLSQLGNYFSNASIRKEYSYDVLNNITNIATLNNNSLIEFPVQGNLGGPVEYSYKYDNYNRLVGSRGFYIGPNDFPNEQPTLLRQQYDLEMQYDDKHNILNKNQYHRQTEVTGLSATPNPWQTHQKTSYDLNYEDYATGGHSSGDYSYVQPHAPRKITETPVDINDPLESQIKVQEIDYDADGNMTTIQQKIKDPDNPLTEEVLNLRKHRWDEEDRLRGVDLMPDNEANMPEISSYTYDASGERVVRYVPGRLDAFYNAQNTGFSDRLESFVYPSGLVTLKTVSLKNIHDFADFDSKLISTYTKHYYIGSERISSALGTIDNLGALCADIFHPEVTDQSFMVAMIQTADQKVVQAAQSLQDDYNYFEKQLNLPSPFLYNEDFAKCRRIHHMERYAAYWFHPDHLGSSSYISNEHGEISQHLEYLPFGETLVEEHKNSNNSPYKFNAKELDDETGNYYYYGARYLNPKWSFWLSVDPLAEKYPGWSPYNYTMLNPVRFIDPDGMQVQSECNIGCKLNKFINGVFHPGKPTNPNSGRLSSRYSRGTGDKYKKRNLKKENSKRQSIEIISAVNIPETSLSINNMINPIDISLYKLSAPLSNNTSNFIIINNEKQNLEGDINDISFDFIGSIGRINTANDPRKRINIAYPLSPSVKRNLDAVAAYLISHPHATVRFQYVDPSGVSEAQSIREIYNKHFQQIFNYLTEKGVDNPNKRVIRNLGNKRGVILNTK